jgi:hypothetical protein
MLEEYEARIKALTFDVSDEDLMALIGDIDTNCGIVQKEHLFRQIKAQLKINIEVIRKMVQRHQKTRGAA